MKHLIPQWLEKKHGHTVLCFAYHLPNLSSHSITTKINFKTSKKKMHIKRNDWFPRQYVSPGSSYFVTIFKRSAWSVPDKSSVPPVFTPHLVFKWTKTLSKISIKFNGRVSGAWCSNIPLSLPQNLIDWMTHLRKPPGRGSCPDWRVKVRHRLLRTAPNEGKRNSSRRRRRRKIICMQELPPRNKMTGLGDILLRSHQPTFKTFSRQHPGFNFLFPAWRSRPII